MTTGHHHPTTIPLRGNLAVRRTWRTPEHEPMPATPPDVRNLRSVLAWSRNTGASQLERIGVLSDALEQALSMIESQPNSLTAWVINALAASMRKIPSGGNGNGYSWIVTNRALHDEALDTIEFLQRRDSAGSGNNPPR